ncbi:hypothetical protein [Parapedobacter tibetensis]|uniref:hypothetical protein n=1 Tax=Parapedobacter tibetensis TaxID=2972951 RepID=UPI00214DBBD2|nr:hypothetical protein [Parapedobacter tibetensis]
MRTIIAFIILNISLFPFLQAQTKVISFAKGKANGLSMTDLDARYKSAVHTDTSLAVFKTEEEQAKFIEAYQSFVKEIGLYLSGKGFEWKNPTRIFNRFYVDKHGNVEYYVYNFLSSQIDESTAQTFETLMKSFFKDHKFGITAQIPFAQCSPVDFQ